MFNDDEFNASTFSDGITTTIATIVLPIAKITDHVAQALDRLAGQFR